MLAHSRIVGLMRRRWVLVGLIVLAALCLALPRPDSESKASGWFSYSPSVPAYAATAAHTERLPRPMILSLRYGRFRPRGAPHSYIALELRAREPAGQIIESKFQELPSGFVAYGDSRCRLAGHKNGRIETFVMPLERKLARGAHRIGVTVTASPCNRVRATISSSRIFVIRASSTT